LRSQAANIRKAVSVDRKPTGLQMAKSKGRPTTKFKVRAQSVREKAGDLGVGGSVSKAIREEDWRALCRLARDLDALAKGCLRLIPADVRVMLQQELRDGKSAHDTGEKAASPRDPQ